MGDTRPSWVLRSTCYATGTDYLQQRNEAIVTTMYDAGLRVGELCAANIDDLGESTWHHTLTLRAETTKASKAAVIALAPRTVQAIALTRDERRSGALLRTCARIP